MMAEHLLFINKTSDLLAVFIANWCS